MAHRVAIGGIFTECNQFGGETIDMDWFARYDLRRGDELLTMEGGAVGGMLRELCRRGAHPVPLIYAGTCPGGQVSQDCYEKLKYELLERLREALPVGGVLMPLHGAAVVEEVGDLEGDLLAAVRQIVGLEIPVVATLDLHAHVSQEMARCADGLVAWETYPHADTLTTGERGARLLLDTLDGHCRPAMAVAKVPVITSAIRGSTHGNDPFARIMAFAKEMERDDAVLSTSAFLVHPNLDLPCMGSGGLVIADGDAALAEDLALRIASMYWDLRRELEPEVHTPQEAIEQGLALDGGPVVLAEVADCCGGGAAGDSVAALAALLETAADEPSLVPVVDSSAAALCRNAGVGAQVELHLGHRHDARWGQPLAVQGQVVRVGDGRFAYRGGPFAGTEGNMGPAAVLAIGKIQVLVTSHPTYDWLDEQYRSMGLDPTAARFVVAKNPMNYRMTYGDVAAGVFILDTPGPTPATVRHLPYQNLERPFFPVDEDLVDFRPTVYRPR